LLSKAVVLRIGEDVNLLTLREVAELVKVSESTVRRWVRDGSLVAYKVGKRGQFRVKEEDLEVFLERQRVDNDKLADGAEVETHKNQMMDTSRSRNCELDERNPDS